MVSEESEVLIGTCEMETWNWSCGNNATLIHRHVEYVEGDTMWRWVCIDCSYRFGVK